MVKAYSNWKLQEKGSGKLTRTELANLREAFKSRGAQAPNKNALKERVDAYKAWKLQEKGTDKITEVEFNALKESVLKERKSGKQSWDVYLANYKQFKESKEGQGAKITYKELKMLKENWREAQQKGIRLREADMGAMDPAMAGMDPTGAGAMPGAVDPATGMPMDPAMAGAGVPMDPTSALAQIADIANQAVTGAADPNALGAAPGIPPVAGVDPAAAGMDPAMAGMDPNAMGAPMAEMVRDYRAWKKVNKGTDKITEAEFNELKEEAKKRFGKPSRYQSIKNRIAERQKQIAALQEGYLDIASTAEMGTLTSKPHTSNSHGGDHSTSESQITPVPTPQQLAKGYSSGAASKETAPAGTWPTTAAKKETDLQGKGASQTNIKEGAKTVTDVYVDRYFEPKLSFDAIRESMKTGLLG